MFNYASLILEESSKSSPTLWIILSIVLFLAVLVLLGLNSGKKSTIAELQKKNKEAKAEQDAALARIKQENDAALEKLKQENAATMV